MTYVCIGGFALGNLHKNAQGLAYLTLYTHVTTPSEYATHERDQGIGVRLSHALVLTRRPDLLQDMAPHAIQIMIEKGCKDLPSGTDHLEALVIALGLRKSPLDGEQDTPIGKRPEERHTGR